MSAIFLKHGSCCDLCGLSDALLGLVLSNAGFPGSEMAEFSFISTCQISEGRSMMLCAPVSSDHPDSRASSTIKPSSYLLPTAQRAHLTFKATHYAS